MLLFHHLPQIGLKLQTSLEKGEASYWFALPDGSSRFLVDEAMLLDRTARWSGHLLDPIKTTNVQNLRAMTTWVVRKTF